MTLIGFEKFRCQLSFYFYFLIRQGNKHLKANEAQVHKTELALFITRNMNRSVIGTGKPLQGAQTDVE